MFEPKYTLTPLLLQNTNEIERLYGQLEAIQAPRTLLLNLERTNLIQSSYSSNSIEGNPLSQAEVTNLLLNDRVPANRDEKEVVNYFKLLGELKTMVDRPFDLGLILRIHQKLMSGVNEDIKGQIRDTEIVVGKVGLDKKIQVKHNPPFHDRQSIKQALQDLTRWEGTANELPIIKAGIYHHQFVYIHPFEDGNGRVCRLTTALIFLKHQYQINKYFVLDDYYDIDRGAYSDSLHSADSGDKTAWLEYFTDGVKYCLQSSLGKLKSDLGQNFESRPTPKEKMALEIVQKYRQINSTDLANELKITRQQAFNLLSALVNKGYLEKKGVTKGSYYILK